MQFAFKEVKQVSNRISNPDKNSNSISFALCMFILYFFKQCRLFKANVSQEILNRHSHRHSHSADICIHFYCLS